MKILTDIKIWTGIGETTIEQRRAFCRRRGKHQMVLQDDRRSNGTRDWKCTICEDTTTAPEGFLPNMDT